MVSGIIMPVQPHFRSLWLRLQRNRLPAYSLTTSYKEIITDPLGCTKHLQKKTGPDGSIKLLRKKQLCLTFYLTLLTILNERN